jgi:hypothetical protein
MEARSVLPANRKVLRLWLRMTNLLIQGMSTEPKLIYTRFDPG